MCKKIKTTITLSSHIKEFASKEAKALGLDFSAYITILIAEKMRGITFTSPQTIISSANNAANEVAIDNKDTIKIDSEQESEIDRLLEW